MRGLRNAVQRHWFGGVLAFSAVAALLGLLVLCILVLPGYLVQYSAGHLAHQLSVSSRLSALNNIRTTLIQALGGTLVLAGATIGAMATFRQITVIREGQITDRLTHAVDQLGHDAVDVRVGGIYALERIAGNSPIDCDSIFDILSLFIRRKSQTAVAPGDGSAESEFFVYAKNALRTRSGDVQAALTVTTRSPLSNKARFVTLDSLDIRGAMLPDANLSNTSLVGVQLEGSWMRNANLREATLSRGYLRRCILAKADLRKCNLDRTDLREADLHDADLRGASLIAADLTGAELIGADFRGATASYETCWPNGVAPTTLGVIVK
jgi:hypothetical protein